MTRDPAFWRDVERIFASVLDADPHARSAQLDTLCAGRADLREEVASLLAAHDEAAGFMATLVGDSPGSVGDPHVGTRLGAYRLLERIGVGGMGAVYRAERVDGSFAHEIAVKITDATISDPAAERRLRAERQILAGLHHPHIVTLLDAGTTPGGHAYLAMEYVEGVPITTYCRERRLSLRERLELFRLVCDAVQYSHQRSVIHRDLKPANILVTAAGAPKVLDFGIAKLLERDGDASVTRELQALTPNYASPEQVRGLPASAASDVYALGVLLYELLTGMRPYDIDGKPLDEVLRIVVDTDVARPSGAEVPVASAPPYSAAGLRGDLDAIVLRALRKEPHARYTSVAALGDDIGRYLAGLPVDAREPSLGYLVGKLATRHKAVFISTAASLAIIVALLGVSLWAAHAAQRERQLAERRFNDVRRLADTLIFKVHDAVAPLPGSTPVRKMLVSEGLAYLERIRADAADDPDLQVEVARAYVRIGSVQGRPNDANLGDREGAVASFRRAEDILGPLAAGPSASATIVRLYLTATAYLSETFDDMPGRHADSVAAARRGAALADAFVARHPDSEAARQAAALASFTAARAADPRDALAYWTRSRDLYAALLAAKPSDADRQRNVALVEKYLGGYFDARKDYAAALPHFEAALALDEERVRSAASDRQASLDLAIDLGSIAYEHQRRREYADAIALYQRSLALREQLSAGDPQDVLGRAKVAFAHRQLGFAMRDAGDASGALAEFRRAAAMYETTDVTRLDTKRNLAAVLLEAGDLESRTERVRACADWKRAFDLYVALSLPERLAQGVDDQLPRAAADAASCGSSAASEWLRRRP